jgi:hypothetical protein
MGYQCIEEIQEMETKQHNMNNKQAKETLKTLGSLFDEYNETGFKDCSKTLLLIWQRMAWEGFDLCKNLHMHAPQEATEAYLMFCGKLMLRFSYLIHHDRVETQEETAIYFKDFLKQKVTYAIN